MKGWAEKWSSFPAAHKKRCYQGLALYGVVALSTAAWIGLRAHHTADDWKARTPTATVAVKSVYLTPQITDAAHDVTSPESGNIPVAAEPSSDDGKTYIAIVMSGLGLSSFSTERALNDLPPQVTLAFSPYGSDVQSWVRKAVAGRHETLMMLPMETAKYPQEDPGPKALSSRFSDADNNENLTWMMKSGEGSVGVMNMMGSRLLTDKKRLGAIFSTLRKNNALFVETPGIDRSVASSVAAKLGLPYMPASIDIDAAATDREIRAQLDALEKTARAKGYAIGIAEPYPLTMNILKSWAAGLPERGITLAPLKTIYKNKPHYAPASQPPADQDLRQPGQ